MTVSGDEDRATIKYLLYYVLERKLIQRSINDKARLTGKYHPHIDSLCARLFVRISRTIKLGRPIELSAVPTLIPRYLSVTTKTILQTQFRYVRIVYTPRRCTVLFAIATGVGHRRSRSTDALILRIPFKVQIAFKVPFLALAHG